MIQSDKSKTESLREIRDRKKKEEEVLLLEKCEAIARERYGVKLDEWRKKFGHIWFLPVQDNTGEIEKLAVMKPIDRTILSYCADKMTEDGLYGYLEACMREVWLDGDNEIVDEEEYFIPCSDVFQRITQGKKAAFLKA